MPTIASSVCVSKLNQQVKIMGAVGLCSALPNNPSGMVQPCPTPDPAMQAALDNADRELLCAIFCCCDKNPGLSQSDSGKERNQYQACVHQTLRLADEQMGFKGRYKSEVSYVISTKQPVMVQGTEPDDNFPAINAAHPGDIRRPDVVIVKNPSQPPTTDNIERIIEMKFKRDRVDPSAYRKDVQLAGGKAAVYDASTCNCENEDDKESKNILDILLLLLLALLGIFFFRFMPRGGPMDEPGQWGNPGPVIA